MKKTTFAFILGCLLGLLAIVSFGQVSDATLTTQSNVIRDETSPGANTKTRIAAMYQAIIDSKVSIQAPRLTTSSTLGYVWTATGTTGLGSWQAVAGGGGGGFVIQDSAPANHNTTWVDTGNAYAGAYPIRNFVTGAWEPVTPSMRYYDPIGNIISEGRCACMLGAGQSSYNALYYQEWKGARTPGYLSTSVTSRNSATFTLGASITVTTGTGLLYVIGDYVNLKYNSVAVSDEAWGNVTAYNSGTGSITFTVIYHTGSGGTYADWVVTRQLPGNIDSNPYVAVWNPTDNEWMIPDVRDVMTIPYSYPTTAWASNLSIHGETNVMAFARRFTKETKRCLRIVQFRKGGTGLEFWVPGGEGYDTLVDMAEESGIPHADFMLFIQGEGGYTGPYANYITALYQGLIAGIRSESFADETTGFIMPSTAFGIATHPISTGSQPADYAIRSLNYSGKNTAWGQGRPYKGIIIPNSPIFTSSTSVNLATATFPLTIFKATGGTSLADSGPYIVASRADDNNFIQCHISAHNTGTGQLTLVAETANPMGYKNFNGTGTHTDWDIIVQDYIHKSVSDHIDEGEASCLVTLSLNGVGGKTGQPVTAAQFDNDNNFLRNNISQVISDNTVENFNHISNDAPYKTYNYGVGGRMQVFIDGSADMYFLANLDGTTPATLSDEVVKIERRGIKATRGLFFTNMSDASAWAVTSIKNGGSRQMDFNIGATTSFEAYDSHARFFMSMDQVNPMLDLYEGGAAGAQVANLTGNLKMTTAGNGLQIKGGTNATIGTATANGSTEVTVNTTKVTANSIIIIMCQSGCGATSGPYYISARSVGTSFGFKSTIGDTGTVGWWILEKN